MIRGALASTRSLSGAVASTKGGTGTPWYRAGGAPLPIAVYGAKGAASLAASYVNVVNPGTFNAAPGVAPTWAAGTGWTFNGTTQYLTTGIMPGTDWSALVRFTGAGAGSSAAILGAFITSGSARFFLDSNQLGFSQRRYGLGGLLRVSPAVSDGVLAMAGGVGYYNGTSDGAISAGNIPAAAIFVGAVNSDGSPLFRPCSIQYVVIWNTSTGHATWMPAVSAAVAAL